MKRNINFELGVSVAIADNLKRRAAYMRLSSSTYLSAIDKGERFCLFEENGKKLGNFIFVCEKEAEIAQAIVGVDFGVHTTIKKIS